MAEVQHRAALFFVALLDDGSINLIPQALLFDIGEVSCAIVCRVKTEVELAWYFSVDSIEVKGEQEANVQG